MNQMSDLEKTERLATGDQCEFRFPSRSTWQEGVVRRNGGSSYWQVKDAATGELACGLYIEHVRAPGTDPWSY